ncbi:hypothetical protein [Amycolatopsis sp. WQ 127309]|uniref:hypothetical protein n=1 Tax=Amycolatopsis sp. WQ 127309 TaxID=2932773 RepID=UPI001FF69770|nr:hypothetical protein [Amycolatopsis sp. WQ 127309]UOZ07074.1 hypothetical protein MUY22_01910 [Amycolatopsis sp. WQ 127309]
MNIPHPTTHATVGAGSHVGIVATEVHNSSVYQVLPGASPAEKYDVGLRYLDDGIPNRARELIEEARGDGFTGGNVHFHWALAMLSKRSYRDLSTEERHQLAGLPAICAALPSDAWTRALRALCTLLDCLAAHDSDPQPAIDALAELDPPQRAQILRHLDLVLIGGLRDSYWADIRKNAEATQLNNDRAKRVWAYFHPRPARPRVRLPEPSTTTSRDRAKAAFGTLAFLVAAVYLGQIVVLEGRIPPILAYLAAAATAVIAIRDGHDWRYRSARAAAKDRLYHPRPAGGARLDEGFARSVDHAFTHYAARYAPRDDTHHECLRETSGFRVALRNEIVEIYRESRIPIGRIRWLIRYETSSVLRRWKAGELFQYRTRYRVAPRTKLRCVIATFLLCAAVGYVIATTTAISPILSSAATVVAAAGSFAAGVGWSRILGERRRLVEDREDYEDLLAAREAAYLRWKHRLDSTRPAETEMERWLNADKIKLLDKALKHYRIAWRDILTHAFLQTPAASCKRARVNGAPWRYSKYDIRLFLITRDGVRELSTELDFENAGFRGEERNNFRFDAVSSVHVATTSELSYSMELVLMNGEPQNIDITDHESSEATPGESPLALAKMSLEAAGFTNTLHILEGIAAEGKNWIRRDPYINASTAGSVTGEIFTKPPLPPEAAPTHQP